MFARSILVLAPHPDDETVGAAAAIRRARARGSEVHVAFLSTGVPAPEVLWPWQRAGHAGRVARRRAESEAAAARLGFSVALRQDIATRTLKAHLVETRARLMATIARVGAEALWAPAYEGGHQDHDAANFLASTLKDRIAVWEFSEYHNAGGRTHSQAFLAPAGTETIVALDPAESEAKRDVLRLYASERGNLSFIGTAREAFRPLAPYDYARPPHPGTLFYQRFQWVWPRHPRVDYTRPDEVCAVFAAFKA